MSLKPPMRKLGKKYVIKPEDLRDATPEESNFRAVVISRLKDSPVTIPTADDVRYIRHARKGINHIRNRKLDTAETRRTACGRDLPKDHTYSTSVRPERDDLLCGACRRTKLDRPK